MIAAVTQGRPRYVLVPIDEFYPYEQSYEQPQIIAEPSQIMPIYRAKRSVGPYEEKEQSKRAAGYSEHGHGHAHDDHTDYGAYTGGYGAFGWYTDHPVLVYHR